jgi:GT2 family glycosyltransferase
MPASSMALPATCPWAGVEVALSQSQVDVLIPVYNAEATVEFAVASIQAQTIRDIRIIVVDDGSTDGSGDILARLADADQRVQVVRQPNGGIVDALNRGLALCTAPFIARHDADDLAAPDRFAQQLDYLEAYPDCIAVDGYYWIIDGEGRRVGAQAFAYGAVQPDPWLLPSEEPYLAHPFLMIRREPMMAVKGYRHAFHSEDTDLYWRLLRYGQLAHVPLFLGEYRSHGGSVSSKSIVNGRIAAINSQLAAISYQRRTGGRADLDFPRSDLSRFAAARSLEGMLAVAGEQLEANERRWLQIAACAKLVELSSYRPYLLDDEDVALMVRTFDRGHDPLLATISALVPRHRAAVAVRLLLAGRWRAALQLSPSHPATAKSAVRQAAVKARNAYQQRVRSSMRAPRDGEGR